jgi:hypothetical protein
MTDHRQEDIVLVSDLHLGPGPLHSVETFFHDVEFCRFLDALVRRAEPEGRTWRLVILGDFLDFLRCELVTHEAGGAPTEDVAMATLERIMTNHEEVFRGLGRFLSAGFPVDIVVGNHDAELIRPALQERMRSFVAGGGAGSAVGNITFHPWIYHLPGVLYAEHGHQHDGFNAFSTVLDPYADGRPGPLERPIGTFLFEAMERFVYDIDPCPDHVSSLGYYRLAIRRHPGSAVEVLKRQVRIFRDLLAHARSISGPAWDARRAAFRDLLPPYAKEVGLSARVVAEIDEMSSASEKPLSLLMEEAVKINTRRSGPALALLSLGYLASKRGAVRTVAMGGTAAGAMAFLRKGLPLSPTGRHVMYLQRAAARIDELLAEEGANVPYYVFAHTHAAQHLPLGFGAGAPQYLNTGTWACLAPPAADTLRTIRPTFVHIMPGRDGAAPAGRLLAWNSSSESAETLRFQA